MVYGCVYPWCVVVIHCVWLCTHGARCVFIRGVRLCDYPRCTVVMVYGVEYPFTVVFCTCVIFLTAPTCHKKKSLHVQT